MVVLPFVNFTRAKKEKEEKKCCSAFNTELFLVGLLNTDLVFLSEGIFSCGCACSL